MTPPRHRAWVLARVTGVLLLVCCARAHVAADPPGVAPQVSAPGTYVCLFRDRTVTCLSEMAEPRVLSDVDSVSMPEFLEAETPCALVRSSLRCFGSLPRPWAWGTALSPGEGYTLRQYGGAPLYLGRDSVAVLGSPTVASSVRTGTIPGLVDAAAWGFTVVALAGTQLGLMELETEHPVWQPLGEYPPQSHVLRILSTRTIVTPLVWTTGSTRITWFRDGLRTPPQLLDAPTPAVQVVANPGGQAICTLDADGRVACANDARLRCDGGEESPFRELSLPGPATSLTVGPSRACALVGGEVLCWGRFGPGDCSRRPVPVRFGGGGP